MPIAGPANGTLQIESHRVDDERISVPSADRVAHPALAGLMRAVVDRDDAEEVHVFVEEDDVLGRLNDLERVRTKARRHGADDAVADNEIGLLLDAIRLHSGLQRRGTWKSTWCRWRAAPARPRTTSGAEGAEDALKVWSAVGHAWNALRRRGCRC